VKDNDTGAEATGNGEATIEGALMNTHWYELDKSQ
jgi:hypothetical protein